MMESIYMEEIKHHLEKAHGKLNAARVLYENKIYEDCVSRAYYSMFHAAKAVLLLKGIKPKKHRGVIQKFGLEFVNEGYISRVLGKAFSTAREDREYADYDVYVEITKEEAETTINDAEQFLEAIENVVKDFGEKKDSRWFNLMW